VRIGEIWASRKRTLRLDESAVEVAPPVQDRGQNWSLEIGRRCSDCCWFTPGVLTFDEIPRERSHGQG
jgi:hypothetical protein